MRRGKSALTLPRYISPASIAIGDTVKVSWEIDDIEHTRSGTIVERQYEGSMRVFTTLSGAELFRWHPTHKEFKVTLLSEAKNKTQEMLELFQIVPVE